MKPEVLVCQSCLAFCTCFFCSSEAMRLSLGEGNR